MYSNVMKMPSTFSNLSADEMEYDGTGLFSRLFKAVAVAVAAVATVCVVVGVAATCGVAICAGAGLAAVAVGLGVASKGNYFM